MVAPLEEWSFFDHLRFLGRAWYWVLGAGLVAAVLASVAARVGAVYQAEVLLQLGHNSISGWLEPPNELLARVQTPTFLDNDREGRPAGPTPTLSATQIPSSGYLRLASTSADPLMAEWALNAAVTKIVREHAARAKTAQVASARRAAQLDRDIGRLRGALAQPMDNSPQMVVERLRLVQRLGIIERERDDLEPDVEVASPLVSRAVQPVVMVNDRVGMRPAIYGGVAGLLLALTLLYLGQGLRALSHHAQYATDFIEP